MAETLTDRFARLGPQSARLAVAGVATLVVVAVSAILVLAGVDTVETVATLLVAPVFVVALVAGRGPGFFAAALATGVYVVLRRPDLGDTGSVSLALLAVTRAVAYGIVAHAGAWARTLVSATVSGADEWADSPLVLREERWAHGEPDAAVEPGVAEPWTTSAPVTVPAGAPPVPGDYGGAAVPEPVPARPALFDGPAEEWVDEPHPSDWRVGPSALPPDDPESGPWTGPTELVPAGGDWAAGGARGANGGDPGNGWSGREVAPDQWGEGQAGPGSAGSQGAGFGNPWSGPQPAVQPGSPGDRWSGQQPAARAGGPGDPWLGQDPAARGSEDPWAGQRPAADGWDDGPMSGQQPAARAGGPGERRSGQHPALGGGSLGAGSLGNPWSGQQPAVRPGYPGDRWSGQQPAVRPGDAGDRWSGQQPAARSGGDPRDRWSGEHPAAPPGAPGQRWSGQQPAAGPDPRDPWSSERAGGPDDPWSGRPPAGRPGPGDRWSGQQPAVPGDRWSGQQPAARPGDPGDRWSGQYPAARSGGDPGDQWSGQQPAAWGGDPGDPGDRWSGQYPAARSGGDPGDRWSGQQSAVGPGAPGERWSGEQPAAGPWGEGLASGRQPAADRWTGPASGQWPATPSTPAARGGEPWGEPAPTGSPGGWGVEQPDAWSQGPPGPGGPRAPQEPPPASWAGGRPASGQWPAADPTGPGSPHEWEEAEAELAARLEEQQRPPDPWEQVQPDRMWRRRTGPTRAVGPELPAPPPGPPVPVPVREALPAVDPETKLWSARYLCDRLATEQREAARAGRPFSLVLVQVPDGPLAALSYRRQVTLLRELGHQFVAGGLVDHLVHVPDQVQHWFAVILPDTDRVGAQTFERRLRNGIGGYLRSRGLLLGDLESACLTSPDDDSALGVIWDTLIARGEPGQPGPGAAYGSHAANG